MTGGLQLDDVQVRVLGCLIEKETTVPDVYPMTLRALTAACNQSSSRDPVTDHGEPRVQSALDSLKADHRLVRFVHPSHGARSTKFRHVADERLGLDVAQSAVLSVLMLRGPQTAGELRTRSERQHRFESLDEVLAVLDELANSEPPLVAPAGREPGQKEQRWAHLLGPGPARQSPDEEPARAAVGPMSVSDTDDQRSVDRRPDDQRSVDRRPDDQRSVDRRLDVLEQRVAALEAAIDRLVTTPPEPPAEP